jgi:glutaconate CoA-transferase subunit A
MNVPFAPVRGLLGSDYMTVRKDFLEIANPYEPEEPIAVVPALRPDVAVFHGTRADRHGNVLVTGERDAKLIAQAARRSIATVEEVVDGDLSRIPRVGELVPGIHVTAVVHAARGAHPTACRGYYGDDRAHIREYMEAARSDEAFRAYLDRYVLGTRDHAEYLRRVDEPRPAAVGA